LRAAHWENGRYRLLKPSATEIQRAEGELAYWEGGNLHARFGPPYKPSEIQLAWCWGPDDLERVRDAEDHFLFRADYGIPGTCPGEFVMIWKYDFPSFLPEGYIWGCRGKGEWRRFYTTPFSVLAQVNEANNFYEEK
jgi:hypothetical protein